MAFRLMYFSQIDLYHIEWDVFQSSRPNLGISNYKRISQIFSLFGLVALVLLSTITGISCSFNQAAAILYGLVWLGYVKPSLLIRI